jgi:2-dehydro-3-deoxy-D-arabinonate dehydratase
LVYPEEIRDMPIHMEIMRGESSVFNGNTRTSRINRSLESLVDYLFLETDFPSGVFLMTGTGIVPPEGFSLSVGDKVLITIGELHLENVVSGHRERQ